MKLAPRTAAYITLAVLASLIAWPFVTPHAQANGYPAPAPVLPDYLNRNATISVFEKRAAADPRDQFSRRILGAQYLQRFRERGDFRDLDRAKFAERQALALQPANADATRAVLIAALSDEHRFHAALPYARESYQGREKSPEAAAQLATLEIEIGNYAAAARALAGVTNDREVGSFDAAQARMDELTGKLAAARQLIDRAMAYSDAVIDNSAESRAWYHFRAGELAFEAGDAKAAEGDERDALARFPEYAKAYNMLARIYCATHRWQECLEAAHHGARLFPLPETLGYEADAQRALGDRGAANSTDALIGAVERIGNSRHISDRLLAVYYSEHDEKLPDALAIARRELAVRDDIYAEDTLAWAAYKNGRWQTARTAIAKALRFDTQDAKLQYHAGMIALHFGETAEAKRRLRRALALNPVFHPTYADDARRTLAHLP